jgi:acyl carrier protein
MSTLETLQEILIDEFDLTRAQLLPEAALTALGVDSLDLLELMFKIEDRYKLAIRDDVPTDLHTIADVVVYIDGLLARQETARGAGSGGLRAAT